MLPLVIDKGILLRSRQMLGSRNKKAGCFAIPNQIVRIVGRPRTASDANEMVSPSPIQRRQVRGGGDCFSSRSMFGSNTAQLGALEVQMVTCGFPISGSSSVPARTPIMCSRASL